MAWANYVHLSKPSSSSTKKGEEHHPLSSLRGCRCPGGIMGVLLYPCQGLPCPHSRSWNTAPVWWALCPTLLWPHPSTSIYCYICKSWQLLVDGLLEFAFGIKLKDLTDLGMFAVWSTRQPSSLPGSAPPLTICVNLGRPCDPPVHCKCHHLWNGSEDRAAASQGCCGD